jgi:two-component system sensor histidine kinase CpxA
MKIRFPLYTRILFWFFLNLMVLGAVFYTFFKIQFRLGLDSLLLGPAGDRIQAVSELLAFELDKSPRAEWNTVLKRYSDAYKVQFFVFRNSGVQAGGETITLPAEVLAKIAESKKTTLLRGRSGMPQQLRSGQRPEPPIGPGPEERSSPPVPNVVPAGASPRFMLHTSNPARYWVGIRIRISGSERATPFLATLLAMSDSILGGGLFFDVTPWIGVAGAVVFISALFWLPVVRGITRSVSQMTHATEEIAAGRFEARLRAGRRDELGRLGQAINRMASRLSGYVTGQKRFLGDIAHELCSPIARIQMALGILEERGDPKQKPYVEDVREEIQAMSSLVDELLSFSKASLEPAAVKLQPVSVRKIAEEAIRREASSNSNIQLEMEEGLNVLAAPELLLRSMANLIRNAIRYAGHAGPITISGKLTNGHVVISVDDSGPGIPEDALAQIFDPFYRPQPARDRESGGVGLGLAIVKTCVESCRGTVVCRNRKPSGVAVLITLPSA